ncbi:MAG: DUF547 domain-containing protein [Magnetovibrionaceae bacterium]
MSFALFPLAWRNLLAAGLVSLGLSACANLPFFQGEDAEPWEPWAYSDETSPTRVDHGAFDRFLANVERLGGEKRWIAFARMTIPERNALDNYLSSLRSVRVSILNRREQMAFWVNLHNALTIRLITTVYPARTVSEAGLRSDQKLIDVEGVRVSLNDIRNRIIRPFGGDPRLAFALFTGDRSGPSAPTSAFDAARWDEELDRLARAFVNRPDVITLRQGQVVALPRLFFAWGEDFGRTPELQLLHILKYADPRVRELLDGRTGFGMMYYDSRLQDGSG